jgi:NAD+ kinase
MSDRQDEGVNDVIARPPLEDHHNHNHHATRNPPSDRCRVSRHASGGSDEYAMDAHHHQEVEISFLPAKLQSHRRKSSMVDAGHDSHGTDCFVHQFIDSHRRPKRGPPSSGTPSSATASTHGQTSPSPSSAATTIAASPVEHDSGGPASLSPLREEGGATPEPPQRCGGFGQADEKEWAGHMMARSKMTMLVPGGHPGGEESVAAAIGEDGSDDAHSRLLTKRQLNEMVWGVRELGRRLGNMKVRFTARSILILTKIHDEDLIPLTRELAGWLLSDGDRGVCYTVYVDERLRENRRFDADGLLASIRPRQETTTADGDLSTRLRYWTADMCRSKPHLFDFVITLGGDGTVLYTSWLFQRIVPPVLSFSLGSLGFLSKFDFADYRDTLTTALTKGVTISLRLRFEGTIMRSQPRRQTLQDGEEGAAEDGTSRRRRDLVEELIGEEHDGDDHTHRPDATYEILNEIVVDRGPNPSESIVIVALHPTMHTPGVASLPPVSH